MIKLEGAITALITPFKENGAIDYKAFENLIKWQIQNGINGLVVNGTTGESPNISEEELAELITIAKQNAANIPVIAGVGSNSTAHTVKKAQLAQKTGADAIMVVCPYYNKPTQEGLYQHFATIAKSISIPVILYNIPGRTSVNLEPSTAVKLFKDYGNIIGIKEANKAAYFELSQLSKDFIVLCDDDIMTLAAYALGARATVSVLANVLPDIVVTMNKLCLNNDIGQALEIYKQVYPLINLLFVETNPAPTKFALSKIGICQNILRLPLVPIKEENQHLIVEELSKFYEL